MIRSQTTSALHDLEELLAIDKYKPDNVSENRYQGPHIQVGLQLVQAPLQILSSRVASRLLICEA